MWRDRVAGACALKALLGDDHGSVAVYAAIMMPILLGSIGLGVDMGLAYSSRQSAQNQADAGAMAAALEIKQGKKTDEVEAAATSDAKTTASRRSRRYDRRELPPDHRRVLHRPQGRGGRDLTSG